MINGIIIESGEVYETLKNFSDRTTIYLKMIGDEDISKFYQECPWAYVNVVYKSGQGKRDPIHYITTDLSTLHKNDKLGDLKYITDFDPSHHEPRIIVISSSVIEEKLGITRLTDSLYSGFLSDWMEYGGEITNTVKRIYDISM